MEKIPHYISVYCTVYLITLKNLIVQKSWNVLINSKQNYQKIYIIMDYMKNTIMMQWDGKNNYWQFN